MANKTLTASAILAATFLEFYAGTAQAAENRKKAKTPSPGSLQESIEDRQSSPASSNGQKNAKKSTTPEKRVLLDAWYTIKANGKTPYAYYNDRIEERGGKIFFQNHVWKNEEGYINEEQLGAYAQPDENLTPLFYNFHSTYRTTETVIDGTVNEGKHFVAKVRQGERELPVVRRTIPSKTIFAVFFPLWLQSRAATLKIGESRSFTTILEDDVSQSFAPIPGRVRAEKPDERAKKIGARLFSLDYRDGKSLWWLDSQGVAVRAEMPTQHVLVERVSSEAEARKFLESSKEGTD